MHLLQRLWQYFRHVARGASPDVRPSYSPIPPCGSACLHPPFTGWSGAADPLGAGAGFAEPRAPAARLPPSRGIAKGSSDTFPRASSGRSSTASLCTRRRLSAARRVHTSARTCRHAAAGGDLHATRRVFVARALHISRGSSHCHPSAPLHSARPAGHDSGSRSAPSPHCRSSAAAWGSGCCQHSDSPNVACSCARRSAGAAIT